MRGNAMSGARSSAARTSAKPPTWPHHHEKIMIRPCESEHVVGWVSWKNLDAGIHQLDAIMIDITAPMRRAMTRTSGTSCDVLLVGSNRRAPPARSGGRAP